MVTDIAIEISKLISDIRDLGSRNTDFSNTVEIPNNGNVDQVFEYAFEVNIAHQTFNSNLKTPVSYQINGIEVIGGFLKLSRMRVNKDKGYVIYECEIKGYFSDLFFKINELFLTDLDFSEYGHVMSYTHVLNTWDPTVIPNTNVVSGSDVAIVAGIGYRYPLIDYGFNNGLVHQYRSYNLRPLLFAYEYLLKIFFNAGKTFSSTFLSSAFFKAKAIPCTEILQISDMERLAKEFLVGNSAHTSSPSLSYNGTSWELIAYPYSPIMAQNTPAPYNDAGGQYNVTTGEITIGHNQNYTLQFYGNIALELHPPATTDHCDNFDLIIVTWIEQFISGSWATIEDTGPVTITIVGGPLSGGGTILANMQVALSHTAHFLAGELYRITLAGISITGLIYRDIVGNAITTGFSVADITMGVDDPGISSLSRVSLTLGTLDIYEGDTVNVNSTIPVKVLQKDFLKSIFNIFNLYAEIDVNDPNNYIIETRSDFFLEVDGADPNTYYDWTNKLDITKELITIPSAAGSMKGIDFLYKTDGDYYNKAYQDQYSLPYGTKQARSENQFNTEIQKIELVFSPTPLVGNDVNSLIIPKIYKNDNGVVSSLRSNIRLLHWGGSIRMPYGNWQFTHEDGTIQYLTNYPYVGHLDNPYTPTYDLCFDKPLTIFYNLPFGTVYPVNSTIYEVYYKDMFLGITNKDAKTLIAYFDLNELDIKFFTFRKKIFVDNAYYICNSINDFNILTPKTTQAELLKLP